MDRILSVDDRDRVSFSNFNRLHRAPNVPLSPQELRTRKSLRLKAEVLAYEHSRAIGASSIYKSTLIIVSSSATEV